MGKRRIFATALLSLIGFASTAHASLACFKDPANNNAPYAQGMNREGMRDQMMREMQDPAQDLLMCFMQTSFEGPQAVLGHCGCKEAVDELCEFKKENGSWRVYAKGGAQQGWCAAFLPAFM